MSEAEDVCQVSTEAEHVNRNQVGFKTKLGNARKVSSSRMSTELIDKSSNCSQPVRELPCEEAHCQNSDNDCSLKSNCVKSSSIMTDSSMCVSELKLPGGGMNKSPDNTTGGCTEVPNKDVNDQLEPVLDDKRKCINSLHQKVVVLALKSAANDCNMKKSGATEKKSYQKKSVKALNSSTPSGRKNMKTPESKVNGESSSPAVEPNNQLENASSGRKRGRKKQQRNREINDEFSRIRVRLRYLLNRIRREQNLLDAYSSEGWRGQCLEKLRPEKELERAKLDINRSKLKIRALFQRLDEVSAEGQFPKSLFDPEGLLDSEDIYCAKCGRKDLSLNNDIILCDGACDRGFHQLCLDPPLRTEEIPPGDEGWYCPACDCKFDCVELLNDSMGTKLSMSHTCERVFPEATAKAGIGQDDIAGLPSDDSEDDDFNPNGADDDNVESGDSSSDESDFSSASEDLGAITNNNNNNNNRDDQYLGLPSDDSEDDDFEPNFVDAEDQPDQEEGSSSDFTSASEDLHAVIDNDEEISTKDKNIEKSPSEIVQDFDDIEPVTGRRQVDKLDYKKLYDETYGNSSSDSSEDEDWQDAVKPNKRKNSTKNPSPSSNGEEEYSVTPKRRRYGPKNATPLAKDTQAAIDGPSKVTRNTKNGTPLAKGTQTPTKVTRTTRNSGVGVSNDSPTPQDSSGAKANKRSPYVKLADDVIQKLNASFEKNQYPDRATKEKLAEELGMTVKQVDKWFGNTRWAVNHPANGNGSSSGVTTRGRRKVAP